MQFKLKFNSLRRLEFARVSSRSVVHAILAVFYDRPTERTDGREKEKEREMEVRAKDRKDR